MPVKLIKVQRDLNVGITTVVEFLHAKGYPVESNPNTKIADEQYILLVKEFGKDLTENERKKLIDDLQSKETPPEKPEKPEEKPEPPKPTPVIPKPEPPKPVVKEVKPSQTEEFKLNVIGQIDLSSVEQKQGAKPEAFLREMHKKAVMQAKKDDKRKHAKPPVQVKQEKTHAPQTEVKATVSQQESKANIPVKQVVEEKDKHVKEPVKTPEQHQAVKTNIPVTTPEVKTNPPTTQPVQKMPENKEQKPAEQTQSSVFRLKRPELETGLKVTGKIDLDSLNQSTRPKKKSKEERKKERDDKRKHVTPQKPQSTETVAPKQPQTTNATGGEVAKKKRRRIKKDRVDINTTQGTNVRPVRADERKPLRLKKPVKAEVNEEDVQKQVKETLARLTNKGAKSSKGAKYRRDKRDAAEKREYELHLQEERESKVLKLTEFVTANDLANMMNISVSEVISTCMSIGIMVSINQRLDAETINIVAEEFGFKTEYVSAEVSEAIKEEEDNADDYVPRAPIVTVMGHVDHGKTSLLDNIRNANVIAGEAGGITQHIGAYNVELPNGRKITFLDTPGHEAFTAMRARGAKVTDIVIIIIAADDNVMPQTIEAINHASAAGVPIVFAINKIDKAGANPDKIRESLSAMNYLVEEWGGKYQCQEISAKKGIGVEDLLEKVLLEADMLELKANPNKRATASVIESSLDKGRGYVATILVSNGTIHQGDIALAGTHYGRIKAMFNERNQRVEQARPSEPVLILGLDGAPQAGDTVNVLETEQEAREIANRREQLQRELGLRTQKRFGLEELGRRRALGDFHELKLIVKGDVDGSVEALSDSLIKLSTPEIQVMVIHKAVGQISDSDIALAASSDAVIIGFQVRPALSARRLAEKEGVEIRLYSIIYDAIEEVKSAMEGMLSPEIKEDIIGNLEVQQVFKISKVGTVAGCVVKDGKIKRTNKVRVIRDGIVIHTGDLGSLKRFKDEVKEVVNGQDCGIFINNYNDIQIGDIIESFDQIQVKKTL
ncbi:MAG: translation initiation factor IF-2 [Tannerella sp.]|jgi:translation initiation factor IF-2|nr:translation initiation factor IF-2 [Tannerella sp.]